MNKNLRLVAASIMFCLLASYSHLSIPFLYPNSSEADMKYILTEIIHHHFTYSFSS